MNKSDRKQVSAALQLISDGLDKLRSAHDIIDPLADAEQEKFDNMTEGLQQGERGQAIEAAASKLDEWRSALSEAIDALESMDEGDLE